MRHHKPAYRYGPDPDKERFMPKKFSRKWRERHWFCQVSYPTVDINWDLYRRYFHRPTHAVLFLNPASDDMTPVYLHPIPYRALSPAWQVPMQPPHRSLLQGNWTHDA